VSTPTCPACGSTDLHVFHEVTGVPVNSCLLVDDADTARSFPRGDLRLAWCDGCGFVTNLAFDAARATYSQDYEETQGFSPHFRAFIQDLSQRWVRSHELQGKDVVEIGCGKGEFLWEMARAGIGHGVGVDPGVKPERTPADVADALTWVQGFFPQDHPVLAADAVVCRHTLEHIGPVEEFMRTVRAAIGDRTGTAVLFELPGTMHVLRDVWFWDTYYEHCSYFTAGSLARLFRRAGFHVVDVRAAYDEQYLLLEARPVDGPGQGVPLPLEESPADVAAAARQFAEGYRSTVERWRTRIRDVAEAGGRSVVWGSGSKGVAFLAALGEDAALVECAVDINPHKHGRFMAGSGHRIIAPKELLDVRPALVVAMNSTYLAEIGADLTELGLDVALEGL